MLRWWLPRILVACAAVVSIALALKIAGGPDNAGGLARTSVLLDTVEPQLVDPDPAGVESLPWRATMLAQLAGSEPTRTRIAGEVGIPTEQLAVVEPKLNLPTVPASLPRAASEAAALMPEPFVLTLRSDEVLPVISIKALAPDRAGAARLAKVAVGTLEASALPSDPEQRPRFTVKRVGAINTRDIPSESKRLLALAVGSVVLGLGCAGIALAGRFRSAAVDPASRYGRMTEA